MPKTRIDLPQDVRDQVCDHLNRRLADLLDLQLQSKQAHWNVRGMNFIAVHEMFDKLNEEVAEYVDSVAERIVQLGGVAMGTAQTIAENSGLDPYPTDIQSSRLHLEAMASAIAKATNNLRTSIDWLDEFDEEIGEDILIGVAKGLDKWLWFVSAHVDVDEEKQAWQSKAESRKEDGNGKTEAATKPAPKKTAGKSTANKAKAK